MDLTILLTLLATTITTIAFVYGFLRNFKTDIKTDINGHIDRLEKRMDTFENKLLSIDERMFLMLTGKRLEDAILEERMKQQKNIP